jgi:hypothetical protein
MYVNFKPVRRGAIHMPFLTVDSLVENSLSTNETFSPLPTRMSSGPDVLLGA